jgi:hypothetical protein
MELKRIMFAGDHWSTAGTIVTIRKMSCNCSSICMSVVCGLHREK